MTLTEFLLARIAETQEAWGGPDGWETSGEEMLRAWIDADREAKRRIVEGYDTPRGDDLERDETTPTPEWVLRLLALPYSGHPDYRQQWRP